VCLCCCVLVGVSRSVNVCCDVCCSVLQCVAVCCSVLQCVAVCCSVLQRVAQSVLQRFHNAFCKSTATALCNTLRITAPRCNTLQHTATHCNTLQHTVSLVYDSLKYCNTLLKKKITATHCVNSCNAWDDCTRQ